MIPTAVEQAKRRYAKAAAALTTMRETSVLTIQREAWSDFLLAHAAIYSKLEQGSKANGRSTAWFGRKKSERKKEGLLSYLHHARNSDEHGIEEITKYTRRLLVGKKGDDFSGSMSFDGRTLMVKPDEGTSPPSVEIVPVMRLIPVKDDRFGDTFYPPHQFRGAPLVSFEPTHIGGIGLDIARQLIEEAEALV